LKSRIIVVVTAQSAPSGTAEISQTITFSNEFWHCPLPFSQWCYWTSYLVWLSKSLHIITCPKQEEILSPQIRKFSLWYEWILDKKHSGIEKNK